MGLAVPKQFYELGNIPLLIHTLSVFQQVDRIGLIVVAAPRDNCSEVAGQIQHYGIDKVFKVVQD